MADKTLLHDNSEFQDLVRITAQRLGTSEGIVEKDYWVTEVLRAWVPKLSKAFIFKGGTSLSKGYGLIRRFSEDVDILLVTSGKIGQTAAGKLLKKFEESACSTHGMKLDGKHPSSFSGKAPPKRVSILNYPKSAVVDSGVLPFIKLEMAVHGGSFPFESRTINSFIADQILHNAQDQAAAFSNIQPFALNCLDPLRTFAEKVNALASAIIDGELVQKVRHYYDLYYLLESSHVAHRLGSDEHLKIKQSIRAVDVEFKQHKPDHNYDEPGTSKAFALESKLLAELIRAYDSSPIYYGEKPTFEDIMGKIEAMRKRF